MVIIFFSLKSETNLIGQLVDRGIGKLVNYSIKRYFKYEIFN